MTKQNSQQNFVIKTLTDMIRINSVNPDLDPSAPGEAELAAYVAAALREIGLEVHTHEPQPGRTNVVGRLKGRGNGPSLMLYAHEDTVGVEGMESPFSAEIRQRRMYGRGAYDMKAGLAACIATVKALEEERVPLRGDVMVVAVSDEENESIGIRDFLDRYHVDGAVVTEPTDLEICLAHKGFVVMELETRGRAAHGSRFTEGIDANAHMGRVLRELEHLNETLRNSAGHPLVGPPSVHAPMIQGGTSIFVYAAGCRLQVERRTIPGEMESQVVAEIQEMIDRLASEDPTFQATVRPYFIRNPYEAPRDAHIVKVVEGAAKKILGPNVGIIGQTFWMDTALIADAGIETVVIGPKGAGLHTREEWVDLDSVVDLVSILVETAQVYCA